MNEKTFTPYRGWKWLLFTGSFAFCLFGTISIFYVSGLRHCLEKVLLSSKMAEVFLAAALPSLFTTVSLLIYNFFQKQGSGILLFFWLSLCLSIFSGWAYFYQTEYCVFLKGIVPFYKNDYCQLCVVGKDVEEGCKAKEIVGGSSRCKKETRKCNASKHFSLFAKDKTIGIWSSCQIDPQPAPEECNGLDDNCDGQIDNLPPIPCTKQKGVCAGSLQRCEGKKGWKDCTNEDYNRGGHYELNEVSCDGKDNDCDGVIDGLSQPCYDGDKSREGIGVCKSGLKRCEKGQWSPCVGQVTVEKEICDGKDNDCDGKVDNEGNRNLQEKCFPTGEKGCIQEPTGNWSCKGICSVGVKECRNGAWTLCHGYRPALQGDTCNGKDDDCDGFVDNPPTCMASYTLPLCESRGRFFFRFSSKQKKGVCTGIWMMKSLVSLSDYGNWCYGHHQSTSDRCPKTPLKQEPVFGVIPEQAELYCRSLGMRLPQEEDYLFLRRACDGSDLTDSAKTSDLATSRPTTSRLATNRSTSRPTAQEHYAAHETKPLCGNFLVHDLLFRKGKDFLFCYDHDGKETGCHKINKKTKHKVSFFCVEYLK